MRPATGFFTRCILFLLTFAVTVSACFDSAFITRIDEPLFVNFPLLPFPLLSGIDPDPRGDFESLVIPLKRAGKLLLIEATIDGESGNLVFDTGASGLVLNKTYFRNHSCFECGPSDGITGSTGNLGYMFAKEVRISDLYYENIKADVADLGHIENIRGVKIIGLFGFNMIKSFEIVIDANHNELQLHRIDRKGNRVKAEQFIILQDHTQKIDPSHPVLIVKGEIGGKSLNFCLDTGAETNAISNHASRTVLNTISITRRSDLRGVGQASNEVLFGIMNDFKLEKTPLPDMETIVVNLDALNDVFGVTIDGILGNSFLEKGIITINLVKKQFGIHYTKSTAS